jgi:hypothetical protein
MRGQRAPLNENGDGEVDEHFWAQAAADQAAGRAGSDGDEGKTYPMGLSRQDSESHLMLLLFSRRWERNSIQYPVLP